MSEHAARHKNTVQFLTANGFEVVAFDLRGSGRSGGRRQWVAQFNDYVEDTAAVFHWIQKELEPLPLFVLGHSMGGTIAVYFAALFQSHLKGLILSAPALRVGPATPAWKLSAAKVLGRLVPKLRIAGSLGGISRDPEVEKAYLSDPLIPHSNTAGLGLEVLKAFEGVLHQASQIRVPTFIVHGSMDRIVDASGSFEILQRLGTSDKTLHILPGGFHEPHNDIDKEVYFQLLLQWLKRF